jgi:hypothetical protein
VIDDWAMARLSEPERRDFWEICEDRYHVSLLRTCRTVAKGISAFDGELCRRGRAELASDPGGAVGFVLLIACANPLASSGSASRRLTSGEHPATILSAWTRGAKVSAGVREIGGRQLVMGVSEQVRTESLDLPTSGLRL